MKQKLSTNPDLSTDQRAFTLVEVMLYLAIVGLVILIGFNAVGGRTAEVQFTDSARSLHGYITSQYSEFVSGVRPDDSGCVYRPGSTEPRFDEDSDGSCILFGKVFIFAAEADDTGGDDTVLQTYNLVGRKITDEQYGQPGCNSNDLSCVAPALIPEGDRPYQILWGTKFIKGNERNHRIFGNSGDPTDLANRSTDNARGFGWLKNPVSNEVIPIVFGFNPQVGSSTFTVDDLSSPLLYRANAVAFSEGDTSNTHKATMGTEFNTAFCIQGTNGRIAMLLFGEDENQEVINLTFAERTDSHDCTV